MIGQKKVKRKQCKKIVSAMNSLKHTSSQSTIRSQNSEIERAEKEIASIDTKIADFAGD